MILQLGSFIIMAVVIGSILITVIWVADGIDQRSRVRKYDQQRRNLRVRMEMERAAREREEGYGSSTGD